MSLSRGLGGGNSQSDLSQYSQAKILTEDLTLTPGVDTLLDGYTYTIAPGRSLFITTQVLTNMSAIVIKASQPAGANGNAIGFCMAKYLARVYQPESTTWSGENTFTQRAWNVTPGANQESPTTSAGTIVHALESLIKNNSTDANTTVTIEFRPIIGTLAKAGSGAFIWYS